MRVTLCVAMLVLAMAGCREAGQMPAAPSGPPPAPAITPALIIGCMAPFTPSTTRADLAAAFGEDNVRQETVSGADGTRVNVTTLFPGDASRRAEVTFADADTGTALVAVSVGRGATQWAGPNGLKVGDDIEAIERANGGGFLVSGLAVNSVGGVVDWQDGNLADQAPGCITTMRFEPAVNTGDASTNGDQPKKSDLPALRAAEPRVVSFGVLWETAQPQ